jgi:hypothetical protein
MKKRNVMPLERNMAVGSGTAEDAGEIGPLASWTEVVKLVSRTA